jgi:N12 class adenine-specific DNA methylase/predicted RNA methylase
MTELVEALDAISDAGSPQNYRIRDSLLVNGEKQKFIANEDALRVLKTLEEQGRYPVNGEANELAKYVGWGSIASAFDPDSWSWRSEHLRLKRTLSPDEFAEARASTPNAHYTPPDIAKAIWSAVMRLGFDGGNVLEPAVGTGIFFGTVPDKLVDKCRLTGVEKEGVSARIAQKLYPNAMIHHSRYQDVDLVRESYDLVISNIPFGNYNVFDREFDRPALRPLLKSIHNYYLAKMFTHVRPGGLVVAITSRYSLDAKDQKVREYLSKRAHLVGAYRLPAGTFSDFAETSVVADVLFMRKCDAGESKGSGWGVELMQWPESSVGLSPDKSEEMKVNSYFYRHPENVLGQVQWRRGQYGYEPTVVPYKGQRVSNQLVSKLKSLPRNVYTPLPNSELDDEAVGDPYADDGRKTGSYFIGDDGYVWQKVNGTSERVKAGKKLVSRIAGMIRVRDAILELVELNRSPDVTDRQLRPSQRRLLRTYHTFTSQFGWLNNNANTAAFVDDPDAPLMFSIENYDERTGVAQKAAIFSKRVIQPYRPPDKADTPQEALGIVLNETSRVDLDRISELVDMPVGDVVDALADQLFKIPGEDRYVTADEYLSGDINVKLKQAAKHVDTEPGIAHNIRELTDVLPPKLTSSEIVVGLGATWVPADCYSQFLNELFIEESTVNHLDEPEHRYSYHPRYYYEAKVKYLRSMGRWIIEGDCPTYSVLATEKWGTGRMDALKLFKKAMSSSIPTIYDTVTDLSGNDIRVVNTDETLAAREKQEAIKDAFRKWLWLDDERRERCEKLYNVAFNSRVIRKYDGSHLTLPGLNPNLPWSLRPAQKDAIWRSIIEPTTLLWHIVGAGKTAVSICAGMELKRLGLRKKVMHVVPNHMVVQYATEFFRLYPGASLLTINSKQLHYKKRRMMLAKVITNDWDAIIVSHGAFGRIPVSAATHESFVQYQIDAIDDFLWQLREVSQSGEHRISIKELEKQKERLTAKLEKRLAKMDHDEMSVSFDDLGVDVLCVDEFHYYKNLYYPSQMKVAGIGGTESGRAFDMFMKTQWLTRRCECGALNADGLGCNCAIDNRAPSTFIGMTGTAIANTIGECFTQQRYFDMDTLIDSGVEHFDAWAATFGDTVTLVEMKPSGKGWRQNTRFARFNNVPDLLRMVAQFADMQHDWRELGMERPDLINGKTTIVAADPSEDLLEYIGKCDKRAQNLSRKDPREDNILKIMSDATAAGMSMLMVDSDVYDDYEGSKVQLACQQIYEIWRDKRKVTVDGADEPQNLTQIVFLDGGTPGGKTFPMYEYMTMLLVSKGVPRDEIAWIHDAGSSDDRKQRIYDRINAGELRILFGSTGKMGVGTNAQRLLFALHHMDAPWRPADIEQRDGRILRPGNLNSAVQIFRYITKKSFDVYKWQVLETKMRFIHQFMSASLTERTVEDLDAMVVSFAEAKAMAADDQLVQQRVVVDAKLRKIGALRRTWLKSIGRMENQVLNIPGFRARAVKRLQNVEFARKKFDSGEAPVIRVGINGRDRRFDDVKEAEVRLKHWISTLGRGETESVGRYGEAHLSISHSLRGVKCRMDFPHEMVWFATLVSESKGARNFERIHNAIAKGFKDEIEKLNQEIVGYDEDLPMIQRRLAAQREWEHEAEYRELLAQSEQIEKEIDERRKAEEAETMRQITGGSEGDDDGNSEEE